MRISETRSPADVSEGAVTMRERLQREHIDGPLDWCGPQMREREDWTFTLD